MCDYDCVYELSCWSEREREREREREVDHTTYVWEMEVIPIQR